LIWADLLVCVTWEKEVASEGPIRERGGAFNEKGLSESREVASEGPWKRFTWVYLRATGVFFSSPYIAFD